MPPSKKAKLAAAPPCESFLSDNCPPMGIYETLYAFKEGYGKFMGEEGTHPWSQGFPLTTQLDGGPELPTSVDVNVRARAMRARCRRRKRACARARAPAAIARASCTACPTRVSFP